MSLATRCPACQTVFRVVQDQLRVSEGWVRCGRCAEVFNALEHMVEVVKPAAAATLPVPPPPPPAPAPAPASAYAPAYSPADTSAHPPAPTAAYPPAIDALSPARVTPPAAAVAAALATAAPRLPAGTPDLSDEPALSDDASEPPMHLAPMPDPVTELLAESQLPEGVVAAHEDQYESASDPPSSTAVAMAGVGATIVSDGGPAVGYAADGAYSTSDEASSVAAPGVPGRDPLSLLDVRPGWGDEDRGTAAARDADAAADGSTVAVGGVGEAPRESAPPASDAAVLPGFLRQAQRAERWQRPGVRRALGGLLVIGLLALMLQLGLAYRDLLAARWPATRAVLAPLCEVIGCRIEQPRWIDAVVVDSTGLTKIEGSTYRLAVVMRNRSSLDLAVPAVDLMLTDTQGRLVARRTLSARELGSNATALPAQGDLSLQATLQVAGGAVVGYTIELFYP